MARVKNGVGIWSFGPSATRFMPSGCHPEAAQENMPAKVTVASKCPSILKA